jgi:two-component system, sensor histidine kinase
MRKIIMQGSIRKRLVVILFAASIPAIAILLTNGMMNRNRSIEESSNELLQFARQLATIQENTTLTTKVLLEQLARRPEVLQTDVPACQEIFASIVERYPFLFGVHLVNSEGDLVASSRPLVAANFKETKHFQAAVETIKFVPGEYLVGILRPVPIFPFAQPVLDEHGKVQGVLLTALHLGGFVHKFNRMRFPKDSFVGICDRNGIRLFRYPDSTFGVETTVQATVSSLK